MYFEGINNKGMSHVRPCKGENWARRGCGTFVLIMGEKLTWSVKTRRHGVYIGLLYFQNDDGEIM